MFRVPAAAFVASVAALAPIAQSNAVDLDSDVAKFSYAIGIDLSQSIKRQGVEVDVDALAEAFRDVMEGNPLQLTPEQIAEVKSKQEQDAANRIKKMAQDNIQRGKDFLAKNLESDGVEETASGLQYKVVVAGDGPRPTPSDQVVVHYTGTLIDGREFDSSRRRGEPAEFGVTQVIQGWQEALQLMPVGSKWMVYIPSDLAYGPRGAGGVIGPNETLIFEVELLEIKS